MNTPLKSQYDCQKKDCVFHDPISLNNCVFGFHTNYNYNELMECGQEPECMLYEENKNGE